MNESMVKLNEHINDGMKCNNMLMIHLEFEFGEEEKPQPCIKIPVTFEAAIIALVLSACEIM